MAGDSADGLTTGAGFVRTVPGMTPEADLYPPDVDVVTKDMKQARDRAAIGTFLVTLGTGLMLERALDNELDFFWLAIGLALIAAWTQAPRFLAFAIGAGITGSAVGGFFESLVSTPFESTISFLCAAAGFFAIYARYPYRAKWALIPAGVLAALAVASTGVELIGFIPAALTSMMLPLLLIAGGALLLFRNSVPKRVVKVGLVVIAIAFLGSAASTIDKWESNDPFDFEFHGLGVHEYTEPLPDLDGRQLIVETESGSVELVTTADISNGVATARSRLGGPRGRLDIDEGDDTVRVSLRGNDGRPFRSNGDATASWVLAIPADTFVRVSSEHGLVKGVINGGAVDVNTTNGAVQLVVGEMTDKVDVTSVNGGVQINGLATLGLDLHSENGLVLVDGIRDEDGDFEQTNDGPDVTVSTTNGAITVVGVAA
jgi:hypothetical protein